MLLIFTVCLLSNSYSMHAAQARRPRRSVRNAEQPDATHPPALHERTIDMVDGGLGLLWDDLMRRPVQWRQKGVGQDWHGLRVLRNGLLCALPRAGDVPDWLAAHNRLLDNSTSGHPCQDFRGELPSCNLGMRLPAGLRYSICSRSKALGLWLHSFCYSAHL